LAAKQAIKELEQQTAVRQKQKDEAVKLFEQHRQERVRLFGEKDADAEEAKAQESSEKAQQRKEAFRTMKENTERAYGQNKNDIARTQEYIKSENLKLDVQYSDARASVLKVKEAGYPESEEIITLAESLIAAAAQFEDTVPERPDSYGRIIDILNELSSEETSRQGAIKQALSDNSRNIEEMEQLILQGYCVCVIDPEGDYRSLEVLSNVITLGGDDPPPHARELLRALHPDVSVIVDLSKITHQEKVEYLRTILPLLMTLRRRTGLPHKILLDEAHYFLRGPDSSSLIDPELEGYVFVTYRISRLDPAIRKTTDAVVMVTRESDPDEAAAIVEMCRPCGGVSASAFST
jgi:hypothetical protein